MKLTGSHFGERLKGRLDGLRQTAKSLCACLSRREWQPRPARSRSLHSIVVRLQAEPSLPSLRTRNALKVSTQRTNKVPERGSVEVLVLHCSKFSSTSSSLVLAFSQPHVDSCSVGLDSWCRGSIRPGNKGYSVILCW